MSLLSFFLGEKKKTATVAKERLQIILAHERSGRGLPRGDYLPQLQQELLAEGVLDDATIEKIDAEARAEADTAADFAEASPFPTVEDIQKDVYWETDHPAERKSKGRLFFD